MVAIFVVLTIVTFLVVDLVYQRVQRKQAEAPAIVFKPRPLALDKVAVPEGIFFHPGHSWASILRNGLVKIGLDDLTQKLIGPIEAVEFRNVGEYVKQGEPVVVLRQGGKTMRMVSPVDGVVSERNAEILKNAGTINNDPYVSGWLYKIKPSDLGRNLNNLKIAETARNWFRNEVDRLKDFLAGINVENRLVGQTLQDGGTPVEGVLQYMSEGSWKEFEEQFLGTK